MRFWDSSAIVSLFVEQPGSVSVSALCEADPEMVVWWGTVVECASAIARLKRMGGLDEAGFAAAHAALDRLAERWIEVEPTARLRGEARRAVSTHELTTGDALQLAAALCSPRQTEQLLEFICLDGRLRAAAEREGLRTSP